MKRERKNLLPDTIEGCNNAINHNKINPYLYFRKGTLYVDKGDISKGLEIITKAMLMPKWKDTSDAFVYRALLKKELMDYMGVIEDTTKAILLDDTFYNAYNVRMMAYNTLGLKKEAEEDRKKIEKLYPIKITFFK